MRWLVLALILLWAAPVYSQAPNPEKLESLTKAEKEARKKETELAKKHKAIQIEIDGLKKQLVKTASEAENYEKEGLTLDRNFKKLLEQEKNLQEIIYGDRQALMQLMAALQRIEYNPPPPLANRPQKS